MSPNPRRFGCLLQSAIKSKDDSSGAQDGRQYCSWVVISGVISPLSKVISGVINPLSKVISGVIGPLSKVISYKYSYPTYNPTYNYP